MNHQPNFSNSKNHLLSILHGMPQATAALAGSKKYPDIEGIAQLYQTKKGVIVYAEVQGLPCLKQPCQERIFGFHIHKGSDCSGDMEDPFADAMSHYDKNGCEHPYHAGDMPPLFGNDGFALLLFFTDRFSVNKVIGRTMIIHDHPDDFTTQPSGNSGAKIACGVIRKYTASGR